MVDILCWMLPAIRAVEKLRKIYYDLNGIATLLQMEQSQRNKTVKRLRISLSKQVDSFKCLLNEGMTYLGMMNGLYMRNKENTMFTTLLEALDLYTKLKLEFQEVQRTREQLFNGQDAYVSEESIIAINGVYVDKRNILLRNNENNPYICEYDPEESEILEFYEWLNQFKRRILLMADIETLIRKIKKIYVNWSFSSYLMLKDYSKRVKRFLYRNAKILKSNKLVRKKNLNFCCKYHILKKLVMRIDNILHSLIQFATKSKSLFNLFKEEFTLPGSFSWTSYLAAPVVFSSL